MWVLGEGRDKGKVADLCRCPTKLEYYHKGGIIYQLSPVMSLGTPQAAHEDERKGTYHHQAPCEEQ